MRVDRPRPLVWEFFINKRKWAAWYHYGIVSVEPDWVSGARICWSALGGAFIGRPPDMRVTRIAKERELVITNPADNAWETTFQFLDSADGATTVVVRKPGLTLPAPEWERVLQKLKACIEAPVREICGSCGATKEAILSRIRKTRARGGLVIGRELLGYCNQCAVAFCVADSRDNGVEGVCPKCDGRLQWSTFN